jgi:hypothetical protein
MTEVQAAGRTAAAYLFLAARKGVDAATSAAMA